jgi:alpha-1,2-mannosyltransferase
MYAANPATAIPVSAVETRQFLNLNPPHFHLLILPLARLTPLAALLVWSGASIGALVAALCVIQRSLRLSWTWAGAAWTAAGVIICSATGVVIVTGQVTFLLLLPVTLAWAAARRDRWTRAAVWLGIAASLKVFLWIFLVYLIATRRWRAVGAMLAAAAACVAAGVIVFGPQAYADWRGSLSAVDWVWSPMNGSIAGLVTRSLAPSPYFTPVLDAPVAATVLIALLVLAIAAATLIALMRDTGDAAADRAFAALLLAAQLVSPLGWVYYVWLLAGPIAALLHHRAARPSAWRDRILALALPGLVLPITWTLVGRDHAWGAVTFGSIYAWMTMALWLGVMVDWAARDSVRKTAV